MKLKPSLAIVIIILYFISMMLLVDFSEVKDNEIQQTAAPTIVATAEPTIVPTEEPEIEATDTLPDFEGEEDIISRHPETAAPVYVISESDREILARLILLEAGGTSWEEQCACASVVFNRYDNGYWGKDFTKIIYATRQFAPAYNIPYVTPTQEQYDVIDYICQNGPTLPYYVLYFRADYYHAGWYGKTMVPYCNIGNTYFSYQLEDM